MQADCDRANDSFSNPGVLAVMWIFHLSFLSPINSKDALAPHASPLSTLLFNVEIFKFWWQLREATICSTFCKNIENISWNCVKKMKWNPQKSLAPLCLLLDRDFQPPSYNDYDFSLPPQYQGTACVLYATAIISKLCIFDYPNYTYVPEKDICKDYY